MVVLDAVLGSTISDTTAGTVVLTTTNPVAVGGFIVLGITVADTRTLPGSGVAGGSLTWTQDDSGDNGFCNMYIVSAPAPAGLAASTAITATFSGAGSARSILGVSFVNVSARATVDPINTFAAGPWTSRSLAISAGSVLVTISNADGGTSNAITAPSVEDIDVNAGAGTIGSVLAHRIEASAGSYTVAGTWTPGNGGGVLTVEYTAVADTAGRPPLRRSLGLPRPVVYT